MVNRAAKSVTSWELISVSFPAAGVAQAGSRQRNGCDFIVPLNFPSCEDAYGGRLGAGNARPIAELGLGARKCGTSSGASRELALTTYGLADKKKFRQNLRLALDRVLRKTMLCGIDDDSGEALRD